MNHYKIKNQADRKQRNEKTARWPAPDSAYTQLS